jgi:hypothetical protein
MGENGFFMSKTRGFQLKPAEAFSSWEPRFQPSNAPETAKRSG